MDEQTGQDSWKAWKGRISSARQRREDHVAEWRENVDARKGSTRRNGDSVSSLKSSDPRVSVNQDWPLTKAKIAQLYSQTPQIRLTPRSDEFRPAVPIFGKELNDVLEQVNVGAKIEEVLSDVVNASGIGAVLVSCEQRTEARQVPLVDPATLPPDMQAQLVTGALQLPMDTVEQTVDLRHIAPRISPTDLLIPSDFTGSDYDEARWLGEEGRLTWPQSVAEFGLTDDVKEKVLSSDKRKSGVANTLNTDESKFTDTDVVTYQQIFYWRHYYHPEETSFKALQRIVFVDGLEEPVINEPYRAQQRMEDGRVVGVVRNPIQVLTLTYISDDALPPSDSSVGRFQVDELQESRSDMVLQRKHSIPIRWGDTNRVSANSRKRLDDGDYQGFIWTNGPGDRAIGEVARASFPPEKFEFDKIIKNDLTEIWQVGTNQAGAFSSGERSAREAGIIQANFQRRVGQEQDKVTRFLLRIAEVLAGHLAIYGTFDLPDELGEMRPMLANGFTYAVSVDSTVRLDADTKIERLTKGLNLTAQSGYVDVKKVVTKIWDLLGESDVVIDPQPKPPEAVKVSVSDAMQLRDPVMLATLMRTQQAPTPDDLAAAVSLLQGVGLGITPLPTQTGPDGRPPAEVATPDIAHAGWEAAPRIERRSEDGGA